MSTSNGLELLGRGRATAQIDALVAEAHAREEPALIRIAGRPGIGKSSLLRDVLERWDSATAPYYDEAKPADVVVAGAIVRRLVGLSDGSNEDTLVAALRSTLDRRRIVCIDDVQWMDELSARVMRRAFRDAAPGLTLLFGDRREEANELPPHRSIHLEPLRRSAALLVVRRAFPEADDAVAGEIVEASGSLPFALTFLALCARMRGSRDIDDVDPSLDSAVAARLARCEGGAATALRHAALLEAPDLPTIARAMGRSPAVVSAALAECSDLVSLDGQRISFRHATISDGISKSIENTASYHRRLFDACDVADDRPERIARALRAGKGCGEFAAAADLAIRLARHLAAGGALASAAEYARLSLELAPRPVPSSYLNDYAGILQQQARDDEAGSFLRDALRAAIDAGDAQTAADLLGSFSAVALTLEQEFEFLALCERISALAAGDARVLEQTRSAQYNVAAFAGHTHVFDSVDPTTLRWLDYRPLAFAAALSGAPEDARKALQRYHGDLRPQDRRVTAVDIALETAIGLFSVGTGAVARLNQEQPRISADFTGYPTVAALQLVYATAKGLWRDADEMLATLAVGEDDLEPYAILDARMMYHAIAKKPPVASRRLIQTIRTMIAGGRRRHVIAAACWLWIILAQANETPPADVQAFVVEELDVEPMPYLFGGIPLAIALLAPHLSAERCARALAARTSYGSRWYCAQRDLASGVISGDTEPLRRARDAFDALEAPVFSAIAGMRLPVPRAADVTLATALGMHRIDDRRQALTPRESDVVQLAAQGLANRDIARRLNITVRTVEVHLTNSFRKLGVRSRSGLASSVLRQRFGEP